MTHYHDIPCCYFVLPCYNEQEVLQETALRLGDKLVQLINDGKITDASRILFVDDGSQDNTWRIIEELHHESPFYCGIKLSRNKGHQNALFAGLMAAKGNCDISISLDADLQDDIDVLDDFITEYQKGCDVVFGVRNNRDSDTKFKRSSAHWFYRFMNMLGADIIEDHADYRLLSARALEALSLYPEENLFLRGLVRELGFKQGFVQYTRTARKAGKTKYPLGKMLGFAMDGITSFSNKPLVAVSSLGIIIALLSVLGLAYAFIAKAMGVAVSGWTAIVSSIWLLGGIQLLCIGIIGQYVGKIYIESKRRPRYIIESELF